MIRFFFSVSLIISIFIAGSGRLFARSANESIHSLIVRRTARRKNTTKTRQFNTAAQLIKALHKDAHSVCHSLDKALLSLGLRLEISLNSFLSRYIPKLDISTSLYSFILFHPPRT